MVLDLIRTNFVVIYLILLAITYIWYRVHKNIEYKYWFLSVFVFYILYVVKLAFFPLYINFNRSLADIATIRNENKIYLQLIPFRSINAMVNKPFWYAQIVGNIMFLLPLPVFIEILYFNKNIKTLNIILIGISFSLGIELIQYMINVITKYPNRVTDIDDLILNSIGILIGTCAIKRLKSKEWVHIVVQKLILKNRR